MKRINLMKGDHTSVEFRINRLLSGNIRTANSDNSAID